MNDTFVVNKNKRIAKNSAFLYIRMALSMAVSLYTSRVVLNTLGIEDYGVYNIVGGVVVMFGFLNSTMSSATSRFLTYEIGREEFDRLKKVFSVALTMHLGIALIIFLIAETLGLWLINWKLTIPENRLFAANVVYQLSIFAAMVRITQVPYNATIIAREKMNVYAYMEILNVTLKLIAVYLLVYWSFDKLILYGILMLCISVIVAGLYRSYCIKRYPESHFHLSWEREFVKPLLSFSSWDLYGNMSSVARVQGVNFLLNLFFGVVLNAASGIATQVQGVVMSFGSNILLAIKPQIIKSYSSGNHEYMLTLIYNSAKYIYFLLLLISIPLIIEMNFVFEIWLKVVPEYAVNFGRLTLLFNLFANMSMVVISGIHATGKIKRPSFINGSLYLLVLPLSYLSFKYYGGSPLIPFLINVLFVFIGLLSNVYTLSLYVKGFSVAVFVKKVLFICLIVAAFSSAVPIILYFHMQEGWIRFFSILVTSILSVLIFSLTIGSDKEMRNLILNKLKYFKTNK